MLTKEKIKILVSGICGNSYGAQIAKSLTLLPQQYEIFGADATLSPLADTIQVKELIKFPKASSDSYLNTLMRHYHALGIDYYIEGSEAEQNVLNGHRDFLRTNNITWISTQKDAIETCSDKRKLSHFLESNGFWKPRTFSMTQLTNDYSLFPVILKPYAQSGGSKNVYIAQNMEDITAILQLSRQDIDNCVIQEYLGTPDAEYTVGILHNNQGIFIGSATLKRNLAQPLSVKHAVDNLTAKHELGPTLVISSGFSQGLMHENREIENYCIKIAGKLQSTGPLNFQGRLIDGKFYIFEINPRFSGTSFMRALSEFNEADLWIKYYNKKQPFSAFYIKSPTPYRRIVTEIKGI